MISIFVKSRVLGCEGGYEGERGWVYVYTRVNGCVCVVCGCPYVFEEKLRGTGA